MGLGSIFKGLGKIGLGVGASLIPGGTLAKDAIKGALGAAGSAIGSTSNSAATNRDAKLTAQMELAKLLAQRDANQAGLNLNADNSYTSNQIARQSSGDASAQSAWRRLLSAQHTLNPGPTPQLAGKYNIAPRHATEAETQGANALTAEVMARLQGGNPIAPVTRSDVNLGDPTKGIDMGLTVPGKGEKIGGWLAPILTYLGQNSSGQNGTGQVMSAKGGPQLSPADLAYLKSRNPNMVGGMV